MSIYLEIEDGLDSDEVLWRYMGLEKFVSMLQKKSIWLARADTFGDKHEGRFPDEMHSYINKAYDAFKDVDDFPINDVNDFQDYLVKNTFISCWHKNLDENMVMWEIYGKNKSAIAIKTSVGNLADHIDSTGLNGHSLLLNNVIYKNADEITGVLPYEKCFFRKRRHFSFEREVRLSLNTYDRSKPTKDTTYGYELPVFLNGVIDKIMVHPDCDDWFIEAVNSIVEKYELHAPVERGAYGNT